MHEASSEQGGRAMPTSSVSVVAIGEKKCKPFLLEVMVMSPESGFKFEVFVERACTPEKDSLWKLVFDLYKKFESEFVQVVHVSYRAGDAQEEEGMQKTVAEGISLGQARILVNDVHGAAKEVVGVGQPSDEQVEKIREGMHRVAVANIEL